MGTDFNGDNDTLTPQTQITKQIPMPIVNEPQRGKRVTIKISFITIFQFLIKCFICIACIVFVYNFMLNFSFMQKFASFMSLKFTRINYGVWIYHVLGTTAALIWQVVYEYKQSVRRKNTAQKIVH